MAGTGVSFGNGDGGDGGLFGGGGGGSTDSVGGNGGLGGGGVSIGNNPGGAGGYGAGGGGDPSGSSTIGGMGNAFGGAIFVASDATLNITDSAFSGNGVTAATFGSGTSLADGKDLFLMSNTVTTYTLTNSASNVPVYIAGGINELVDGGSLIKEGPGTLTLNTQGLSSYNGDITINAGIVNAAGLINSDTTVNAGGTLKGNGYLHSILNSGVVNPGNSIGTLSTNSYVQTAGGTLVIEINAVGQTDLLNVTTTAALAGTLEVLPNPGSYFAGETFTFLTAPGGVSGIFSTVLGGGLDVIVNYFSQLAQLEIITQVIGFGFSNFGDNSGRTRHYLEELTIAIGSDLANVVGQASNTTDVEVFRQRLDQLNASWFADWSWSNAVLLNSVSQTFRRWLPADPCGCDDTPYCGEAWVKGFAEHVQQEKITHLPGFHANNSAIIAGYDQLINSGTLIGFAGGYTHTNLTWDGLHGHGREHNYHLGSYAVLNRCGWTFDANIVATSHHIKNSRHIEFLTINRKAKSSNNGASLLAHIGAAYEQSVCDYTLIPYLGADYIYYHENGFKEHGANSVNLDVRRHSQQFLRTELGTTITRSWELCGENLIPALQLSVVSLSPLTKGHIRSGFTGQTRTFNVLSTQDTIVQFAPAVSVNYLYKKNINLNVSYSGLFGKEQQEHRYAAGLDWLF